MTDSRPYIQAIHINKVRHLENIDIPLDNTQPRHLILTGPNGCGKTSLLQTLRTYLDGAQNGQLLRIEPLRSNIASWDAAIHRHEQRLTTPLTDGEQASLQGQIAGFRQSIAQAQSQIDQFSHATPTLYNLPALIEGYQQGLFLLSYFDAKRSTAIKAVTGAQKLDLPKVSPMTSSVGARFLQFLVNQENRAALLQRKGDTAGVEAIERWMKNLTVQFRKLFQDQGLELKYDIDNFDYTIHLPGREPFRLVDNQLSDGFSAVLQIVAELLMRMEAAAGHANGYNTPGIVLIDEIETHLHIKLQKTILPFLTAFFPSIQFIVTTHSPFVLTSLPDAVIFDLETRRRWENISPLSASTVIEDYFDLDLYSDEIKRQVAQLEALIQLKPRNEDQQREFAAICAQLEVLDYDQAPELVAQYRALLTKDAH